MVFKLVAAGEGAKTITALAQQAAAAEARAVEARERGMAGAEERPFTDRNVEISAPESGAFVNGTPVIVDDIASSGRTIVTAINRLREIGARPPVCVIIHAVFAGEAFSDIRKAGVARIVTTDSISHESNEISLGPGIGRAIRDLEKALDPPNAGMLQDGPNQTESGRET